MCRRSVCIGVFIISMIVPFAIGQAEAQDDKEAGSLSTVFEKVGETVKNSVQSVGQVAETTIRGVDDTLRETGSFTEDSLKNLTDPNEEKPVSSLINQTIDHIESTVSNTTPVVEETTKVVDQAVSDVKGVTEALPEMPVFTPVVEEAGKVVEETTTAVTTTVNKTVEEVEKVPTIVKPKKPSMEKRPGTDKVQDEVDIKPVVPTVPSLPADEVDDEPSSSINHVENPKMVEPQSPTSAVSGSIEQASLSEIPIERIVETNTVEKLSESEVNESLIVDAKIRKSATSEKEVPFHPLANGHDVQIVIQTNSTTVSSPTLTSGHADVFASMLRPLSLSRDAVYQFGHHFSQTVKSQWSNAPPGQPPRFIPFLVNKLTN